MKDYQEIEVIFYQIKEEKLMLPILGRAYVDKGDLEIHLLVTSDNSPAFQGRFRYIHNDDPTEARLEKV